MNIYSRYNFQNGVSEDRRFQATTYNFSNNIIDNYILAKAKYQEKYILDRNVYDAFINASAKDIIKAVEDAFKKIE